jgi:hypothetical protein
MNTFSIACILAVLGVAHGFSMTMNSAERTYIMVRTIQKNSFSPAFDDDRLCDVT